jgi:LPXTG-motif cell wall-anchored protein
VRQHLRTSSAVVAAAAIAAAVPAVVAPAAYAEEAAPELAISTLPNLAPKPGDVYEKSVTITNYGTAASESVVFRVRLTRGLDFAEQVEGCTYSTVQDQVRQAVCELGTVVEPGASVTTPVRFKALPHALMEAVEYGTTPTGAAPDEGFTNAYKRLTLTSDSSADLVATGDKAEASPGDTVTVNAILRNDGPGWIQNNVSDDLPGLKVQIPPGTTAVEVPAECSPFNIDGPSGPSKPGKPEYVCWPKDATLDVDESHTYAFKLKVKDTAKDTKGEVKASSVYNITPKYDKNLANNTAYLSIDVTGDDNEPGTSGGSTTGGGSGESSTGGNGNAPEGQSTGGSGSTGSTSAGTSTGGTTGSSTSGSTGDTTGGNLASTGSDGTPLLAGAATAAAGLGGLLVLAVRRRRAGAESS